MGAKRKYQRRAFDVFCPFVFPAQDSDTQKQRPCLFPQVDRNPFVAEIFVLSLKHRQTHQPEYY